MHPRQMGILLLLAFVAAQAARDVYLGHLFGQLGLFETAALAFGAAVAVFGLWALLFAKDQLLLVARHWQTIIALNVTTALAWLSYFAAIDLANPAAASLAFAGVAPIGVHLLAVAGIARNGDDRGAWRVRAWNWGLLLAVALLAAAAAAGLVAGTASLAGIGLAALAGMVITVESVLAKRMSDDGISAPVLVATRFILVAAIAAGMTARQASPFSGLDPTMFARQCALLLLILVGPIILAQAGLARTSPLISGAVLALGPVATMALQAATSDLRLAPPVLVLTLLYSVFALGGAMAAAMPREKATMATSPRS